MDNNNLNPAPFTAESFDRFLAEGYSKPDSIAIHPSNYKVSEDKTRVYIKSLVGIFCYRNGVCVGEAMNLDDANAWIDTNKEIEMWT